MKKVRYFFLTVVCTTFIGYAAFSQDSLPELNKQVIEIVKANIGKKVDRGECWDLANKALTEIKADWDLQYKYGNPVNYKKEVVYPGDIIQFEGVKVKYKKGNATYTESMEHHTAVVYRVISTGVFELAHQNTSFSGRKVGLSTLDISTIIKGKMSIYRPVKKRN